MGNHTAGRAMGLAAELALAKRKEGDVALDLLDGICRAYEGCDAEFEAGDPKRPGFVHPVIGNYTDPHPQAALGMLMVEAFAPNGLADLPRYAPSLERGDGSPAAYARQEAASELWFAEVYRKFNDRYDFC